MTLKTAAAAMAASIIAVAHISACIVSYNGAAARSKLARSWAMHEQALDKRSARRAGVKNGVRKALSARAKALSPWEREVLAEAVLRYSRQDDHDPFLLIALIETESDFRRDAVSVKGAVGLMQIRPFVARALAEELDIEPAAAASLHDFETNLRLGSYYLAKMIKKFGNLRLALEAYNLGPARLAERMRGGGKLSWRYASKVLKKRERILRLAADSV